MRKRDFKHARRQKEDTPGVIVLAGANGAGKSTTAPSLLQGTLSVEEFVNADVIARGLSGFNPDGAAIEAGEILLRRIRALAATRKTFAFETTLASRTLAPWLRDLIARGFHFHLVFLWLPNAEAALARVATRVQMGGHNIPEETVRRRFRRRLQNFFSLYRPLAHTWRFYDNSKPMGPRLIAAGVGSKTTKILLRDCWKALNAEYMK